MNVISRPYIFHDWVVCLSCSWKSARFVHTAAHASVWFCWISSLLVAFMVEWLHVEVRKRGHLFFRDIILEVWMRDQSADVVSSLTFEEWFKIAFCVKISPLSGRCTLPDLMKHFLVHYCRQSHRWVCVQGWMVAWLSSRGLPFPSEPLDLTPVTSKGGITQITVATLLLFKLLHKSEPSTVVFTTLSTKWTV